MLSCLRLGVAEGVFLASLCHDIAFANGVEVGISVDAIDVGFGDGAARKLFSS